MILSQRRVPGDDETEGRGRKIWRGRDREIDRGI